MTPQQPQMTTAQALDLPIPLTVDVGGVRYDLTVSPRTFEMEAALSARLERENIDFCRRHRPADRAEPGEDGRLSHLEYEVQLNAVRRDSAAGLFEFEGYEMFRWLRSARGGQYNAYLQLVKASNVPVTEALVARLWADKAARAALEDAVKRANDDPNRDGAPRAPSKAKG